MYCQICGAKNAEEEEYCRYCHQKLMVVSGLQALEEQEAIDANPEEQFSFDEHLLERISILEEVMKRTTETVRHVLGSLYKLEQQILVNQTGITTLRDLLEDKRLIAHEEWSELWETRMDYQLLALEKRERFAAVKDRIASLYGGDDPEVWNELLDEAEMALLGLDVEGAVRILDRAHRRDEKNYELAFFLGETFFNEGAADTARGYFECVLEVKPNHFESLVYGGVTCHELRDTPRAEAWLKRAVALYPDEFLPAFSLGAIYAETGRLPEATMLLERAVEADPLPQAVFLLGRCAYDMGRVGVAIRHLRQVVRMDPAYEEAYHLLGLAYLDRRWSKKAQETLLEAQRLQPGKLHYHELVQLLSSTDEMTAVEVGTEGETSRAAAWGLPSDAVGGETLNWVRQAESALEREELTTALSAFRRALTTDPENPTLLTAYAMACLELDRGQEVEGVIDKVMELGPEERLQTTAYATLIEALRSQGRLRESHRLGRRLLGELDSDFAQTVACFELALDLAEIEEDLDDALDLARRSVELSPREIRRFPLAALGWVHYKRREFDEAVDCLARSNELGPSSRTLTHLGMALLATGERDAARQALVEARQLHDGGLGEKILECLRDGTRRFAATPSSS